MPNWCENYVEIKGPKKILDNIEAIVDEKNNNKEREHGLLNYLRPMPKEEKENWYKWSVDNWGTKWDVKEFYSIKRNGDKLCFSFQSVWSPPTEAFDYLFCNNDGVSIDLIYYEPGTELTGIYNDGEDKRYTLSEAAPKGSKDEFWQSKNGKLLDDTFNIVEQMSD